MKWHSASSARQFRLVNQTLTLDQVAEFWRTRRVKEEAGSFASISAAFGPADPIHPGNLGRNQAAAGNAFRSIRVRSVSGPFITACGSPGMTALLIDTRR